MSYRLLLKNDKKQTYHRVAMLILLLHFIFFNYYLLKGGTWWTVVAGAVITTLFLAIGIVNRNGRRIYVPNAIAFALLAMLWALMPVYWMAALMALVAVLDWLAAQPIAVLVSKENIVFTAFPRRTIQWQQLNNVMLKDRILTIDFKNDKLIQGEVGAESYSVTEAEFNNFCRSCLS